MESGRADLGHLGFYVHPPSSSSSSSSSPLVLGPYNGRPACLTISVSPSRGVCGNAFTGNQTLVVPDVEAYPGHIGEFLFSICFAPPISTG